MYKHGGGAAVDVAGAGAGVEGESMEGRDYKYGRGEGRESSRRMLDFSKRQEPDPHLANQDNIRSRFQRLDAGLSHTYFRLGLGGLRASVGKPRLGRPKLGWFSSAFWRTLLGHFPPFPIVPSIFPSLASISDSKRPFAHPPARPQRAPSSAYPPHAHSALHSSHDSHPGHE